MSLDHYPETELPAPKPSTDHVVHTHPLFPERVHS